MVRRDDRVRRVVEALERGGRVLVTRLQYLGDVILTLPLVDAIRERYPRAEVDYLCRPPASALLMDDPRFSTVLELRPENGFSGSVALVRRLRSRRYDAVVDLYGNPRSAWLTRFTGAALRIGGGRSGRRRLYTHPVRVPLDVRSAMAHHLTFVDRIDVRAEPRKPVIVPAPDEIVAARNLFESLGVETRRPDRPRIGIHPGGKWPVKRWPTHSFADLAGRLTSDWNATVVAFTGPGEAVYSARLKQDAGQDVVILPELPVRTVAAALSLLDGMVVSDGGVMHLSVAVGTPTVGIFGSAEPEIWFPYGPFGPYAPAVVPVECRPCHKHECPLGHTDCLNKLMPEMVLEILRGVLSTPRAQNV